MYTPLAARQSHLKSVHASGYAYESLVDILQRRWPGQPEDKALDNVKTPHASDSISSHLKSAHASSCASADLKSALIPKNDF